MSPQPSPSRPPRANSRFWIVVLLIFGVILLIRIVSDRLPKPDESAKEPGVGQPLPMLQLQSLDEGKPDIGLQDLKGKVVLLNFWGTWCPPCQLELPHIAALHRRLVDRPDFRLLAVSCGGHGQKEQFQQLQETTLELLAARQFDLPSYADIGGTTRLAVEMATGGYMGYPTSILLDRSLTIRGIWIGYRPEYPEQMERRIEELLAERAVPPSDAEPSG